MTWQPCFQTLLSILLQGRREAFAMQQIWYLLFFFFRSLFILTSTNVLIIFLFMGNLLVQPGPTRKVRWGWGENKLPTRDAATVDPSPPPPSTCAGCVWKLENLAKVEHRKMCLHQKISGPDPQKTAGRIGESAWLSGEKESSFFFFFSNDVCGRIGPAWMATLPLAGSPNRTLSKRNFFFKLLQNRFGVIWQAVTVSWRPLIIPGPRWELVQLTSNMENFLLVVSSRHRTNKHFVFFFFLLKLAKSCLK